MPPSVMAVRKAGSCPTFTVQLPASTPGKAAEDRTCLGSYTHKGDCEEVSGFGLAQNCAALAIQMHDLKMFEMLWYMQF